MSYKLDEMITHNTRFVLHLFVPIQNCIYLIKYNNYTQ